MVNMISFNRNLIIAFSILSTVFLLSRCEKIKRKNEAKTIVKEWSGKEITFPEVYRCYVAGNNNQKLPCENLMKSNLKILLYVDSVGCTSCKLQLSEWEDLIDKLNSKVGDLLSMIYFIHPRDYSDLIQILESCHFKHPVFIDRNDEINKLNKFPEKTEYHCFLLDKNNKVLVIGNPIRNTKIMEIYLEYIELSAETGA